MKRAYKPINKRTDEQNKNSLRPLRINFVGMIACLTGIYLVLTSLTIQAQTSKIDEIFKKFQDKEGITSVWISPDLIKFASEVEAADSGSSKVLKNITNLRILAFEHAIAQDIVAFETMIKEVPLNDYKELMVVKENKNDVRMLAKESQGRWNDFLLIVTGEKEHALINIQGSLAANDLKGLTHSMHVTGMEHLAKIK